MDVYRCAECGDEVAGWDVLATHVAVEHVDWVPYLCVHCQQQKPTKQQLLEHIHAKHPLLQPFECKKVDEAKERRLDDILQRCKAVRARRCCLAAVQCHVQIGSTCPPPLPQPQRRSVTTVKPELVDLTEWEAVEPKVEVAEPPPRTSAVQQSPPTEPPAANVVTARGQRSVKRKRRVSRPMPLAVWKASAHLAKNGQRSVLCMQCKTAAPRSYLLAHVCMYHVAEDGFRCSACGLSDKQAKPIRVHIDASAHKAAQLVDVRLQMKARIREQFVKCFGEEVTARANFFKWGLPAQDDPAHAATGTGEYVSATLFAAYRSDADSAADATASSCTSGHIVGHSGL